MSKLHVISALSKWKHSNQLFRSCFYLSLLFLALLLARTFSAVAASVIFDHYHCFLFLEVVALIGAITLWSSMALDAISNERLGAVVKLLWLLMIFVGVFVGASLYYLFAYRGQTAKE